MTAFDLVLRGATTVLTAGSHPLDIGIRDGRIAALLAPGTPVETDEEFDATGLIATPGGIDTHTHVAWPYDGKRTVDGVRGATEAALLGGTTTIIDFVPPAEDGRGLRTACHDRVDELSAGSVIDFGLHPILPSADKAVLADIPHVIADGFTSFKMYTTYEGRRIDDGAAWQLMNTIAHHGGLPGFHAENHELLSATLAGLSEQNLVSPRDYPASRPSLAEAESISMVALFARRIGTPVYIFHISGAEALGAVAAARAAGSTVYAETCTHYLVLDDSVFTGPEPWRFTISPPIRSTTDREVLWEALRHGSITSVGSDHCAYSREDKSAHPHDHRRIPAGAPGIEARTPFLWSEGTHTHGFSPADVVAASSTRAARALGLEGKGEISVGADADIVLWDPEAVWSGSDLVGSSLDTFNLYDDHSGRGRPRHVLLRGSPAVLEGGLASSPTSGRFLARPTTQR